MEGKASDKRHNSTLTLRRAPFTQHAEVSLTDRAMSEEEEFGISAIPNRHDREEEHPTSGQIEASIQKRVLGSFFH